jgi:hypothetical protein
MMNKFLRRYTNIPALIYLLRERKITLLDPASWNDKNVSHYMALYREKKSLKTVLALCFTQATETFHHWRVFADGSSGICIRFKRAELMKAVTRESGVRGKVVEYLKIEENRKRKLKTDDLPFLKRIAYEDESEFRVIYESKVARKNSLDIAIPRSSIDRIILSPWIPPALRDHVKSTIREIPRCHSLDIARSTLISNEQWKELGEDAT